MSRNATARIYTPTARAGAELLKERELTLYKAPRLKANSTYWLLAYVGIIVGALVGAIGINMAMTKDAYELHKLRVEVIDLSEQKEDLLNKTLNLQSPQEILAKANSLGMVPAKGVVMINLKKGSFSRPN